MLTKQKSKAVQQFKYLLLIPVVLGMLVYSSCETEVNNEKVKLNTVEISEEQYLEFLKLKEEKAVRDSTSKLIFEKMNKLESNRPNNSSKPSLNVDSDSKTVPFAVVDEVPIFPGCEGASDKKACFQEKIESHIRKNFNYPKEAQDKGIQGRVSVMFTIDENGYITNIRKRGPDALLEEETVRIIEKLPKMIPGKEKGKNVRVPFAIPVTFRLKDTSDTQIPFPKMADDANGLTPEIKAQIKRYNKLVQERERLLNTANRQNPVIISLEEQMTILKIKIEEEIKILNEDY